MAVRACSVTIKDLEGVTHTVEVTANRLRSRSAGLSAIKANDWVSDIAQGSNAVQVCTKDVPIVHSVQLKDFTAWLDGVAGSPRELLKRKRIKGILGIAP